MVRRYAKDDEAALADRPKLDAIRDAVLAEVPGAAVAADQNYREADLAIDFCEDVPPLGRPPSIASSRSSSGLAPSPKYQQYVV